MHDQSSLKLWKEAIKNDRGGEDSRIQINVVQYPGVHAKSENNGGQANILG